jgi:hypothetical protein
MNNENQIQSLYVQLEQHEMTGLAWEILTYLRNTYPEISRKIKNTRYEKSIPIPEQWELASLLVRACESAYECDVLRAGLRRATHEIEKLRQLKLF